MRRFRCRAAAALLALLPVAAFASTTASYKHYMRAVLAANRGDSAEALAAYEEALALDPESAFLYQNAAELALEAGDPEKAMGFASRFLELSPNSPQASYLLGSVLWVRGEKAAAAAAFEKTLAADPGHADALFALGSLLAEDSPERARRYLEDFAAANPDDASEAFYQVALIEQKGGRNAEAVSRFEAAISADPSSLQAHLGLAQLFEAQGDTVAALGTYQRILGLDPHNAVLLNHVGEIRLQSGEREEARALFLRAKDAAPNHPETCLRLALMAEEDGDFGAAAGFVSDSAVLSEDAGLQLRLSYYLTQSERLQEAVSVLEKASLRWSENEDIAYFLGLGYDDLKKPQDAVRMMMKVLALNPDHRDARFQLGALYEQLGDIAKVEEEFKELLKRHPNDASALNYLGYSLADRGLRLDEAEGYLRRALELSPDKGAYLDSLAWVRFKRGAPGEALPLLERAVSLLPEDEIIWGHLGDVREGLGDLESAWLAWKTARSWGGQGAELDPKIARIETQTAPRVLGQRYLKFLKESQGIDSASGMPCVLSGVLGSKEFRFQGLLHLRASGDLGFEVMGPMFAPVLSLALKDSGEFLIDQEPIEGVDAALFERILRESMTALKDYLSGKVFSGDTASLEKAWKGSRIETPEYALFLDKDMIRLQGMRSSREDAVSVEFSDYASSGGRWVPGRFLFKGRGFSFSIAVSRPGSREESP